MRQLVLVGLSAVLGCTTPSEVVLTVASDLDVPEELDAVRIEVTAPDGASEVREARASDDALTLPVRLRVVHDGGPAGPIRIRVLGLLDEEERVEASARTAFVPGQTVSVWLALRRSCRDVECATDETCEDGECVAIASDVGTLPIDARTPPDDAGSGGLVDAFVPDLGPPCAEGCACEQRCESDCHCRDGCGCALRCGAGEVCDRVRCDHAGTECRVEAAGASALDVQCRRGARCVIDASGVRDVRRIECDRSSCEVSCAGSADCRVECKNDAECLVQCSGVSSCVDACGEVDDDDDDDLRGCGDGLYACRRGCP